LSGIVKRKENLLRQAKRGSEKEKEIEKKKQACAAKRAEGEKQVAQARRD
jgi:hypothetical protein